MVCIYPPPKELPLRLERMPSQGALIKKDVFNKIFI